MKQLIEEKVEPKDVNLNSFKNNKELNPYFFDTNMDLIPKLRKQMLKIADDFYDFLETPWLKIIDVRFTGSLANYNWSKYSDVDIHLIIDKKSFNDKLNITEDFFKSKKKEWGDNHDKLQLCGYPVELYVQPITEQTKEDAAAYSIENDKWIVKPEYKKEPFDKDFIKLKASQLMTKIDEYIDDFKKNKNLKNLGAKSEKLWTQIKEMRKKGLDKEGEFSNENIVFKVLRRTKYLEELLDLKYLIYDKINSLEK